MTELCHVLVCPEEGLAMKTITFEVTQEHIDAGTHSAHGCPVYLAMTDAGVVNFGAAGHHIAYYDATKPESTHVATPLELHSWVLDYDFGTVVKPATFTVDVPDSHYRGRVTCTE